MMLAASDAVLREANAFKVGIIGYIFMDTANVKIEVLPQIETYDEIKQNEGLDTIW